MAIIDDNPLEDFVPYPYHGAFYRYEVEENAPLDQQVDKEVLVYECDCDVQKRSGIRQSNLFIAEYTIYFPLETNPDAQSPIDRYKDCGVRRGMTFKGEFYEQTIEGQVEFIRPSQLGGMSVDIKVVTENGSDKTSTTAG